MGFKLPQLKKIDWFYLCAAWHKNEVEKRLAWLSPTYREWNPKLPWGTTEGATQNARLEPWRRWNWFTDGTPNKWLNVPYEYPWYTPSAQLGMQLNSARYNYGMFPGNGAGIVDVPTGDLAKWNPDAYANRPGPYKELTNEQLEREVEIYLPEDRLLETEYYWTTEKVYCMPNNEYDVPVERIKYKGMVEENGSWVWPEDENGDRPEGTLFREASTRKIKSTGAGFDTGGSYDEDGEYVAQSYFWKNRLGPKTVLWKYTDTYDELDTRHEVSFHYEINWYQYVETTYYTCETKDNWSTSWLVSYKLLTTRYYYETREHELKWGQKTRSDVIYTDEWKKGAYEKKFPYPCYRKPDSTQFLVGYRDTFMQQGDEGPSGSALYFPGFLTSYGEDGQTQYLNFGDAKTEVFGDGNGPGINNFGQTNNWYQQYSYKPSQHWADGWGIRNESSNFYVDPDYHVGAIYNGITTFPGSSEEADPIATRNPEATAEKFNVYFWEGSHKMLHPFVFPGQYWGDSTVDELGLPRAANPNPVDYQSFGEYLTEHNLNSGELPAPYERYYNRWHTHPINHNSANDMYKSLFKAGGVETKDIETLDDFLNGLSQVPKPPGTSILSVPAFPPTTTGVMLDTVFLYNDLCLVPTDWVHTPWSPTPVVLYPTDKTRAAFSARTWVEKPARWQKTFHSYVEAIIQGALGVEPMREWWDGKPLMPATIWGWETLELIEQSEWVTTTRPEFPILQTTYAWGPSVREPAIVLANYPTGFEIDPRHESLCQTRLIGETEMNNRCESIPNWLDTDGGLLFYIVNGVRGVNEATIKQSAQFYFILQSRLPSANHSHQATTFTIELNFSKQIMEFKNEPMLRSTSYKTTHDIERYSIELHFPPDDGQNANFDSRYYPKDTDPGRGKATPPITPNVWEGPSTYPEYDNWQVDNKGNSVKKGTVFDKRNWQANGSYRMITSSVEIYEYKTTVNTPEGEQPTETYVLTKGRVGKRQVPPYLPYPAQPEWEEYETNHSRQVVGPSVTTTIKQLILEDCKITSSRGIVYRSYSDGGPAPG